ncbi:MAG: hypothetical protein GF411_15325 [Candidatus Lokiarchaeota archaeon]|nr:hypothetical protein [Candidatus Lokiarchaeota archaeon]
MIDDTANPEWYKLRPTPDRMSSYVNEYLHFDTGSSTMSKGVIHTRPSTIDTLLDLFGILDDETASTIEKAIDQHRKQQDESFAQRIQRRYHESS